MASLGSPRLIYPKITGSSSHITDPNRSIAVSRVLLFPALVLRCWGMQMDLPNCMKSNGTLTKRGARASLVGRTTFEASKGHSPSSLLVTSIRRRVWLMRRASEQHQHAPIGSYS